ncbi:rod shape-determining protein RodA [Gammaproteobacteria bacterium]|nr:rod shape-determining protein RodA [Gammaproteobacteria bacterium]
MSQKAIKKDPSDTLSFDVLFRTKNQKKRFSPFHLVAFCTLMLMMLSCLFQYSASSHLHSQHFTNHLMRIFAFIITAVFFSRVPKKWLKHHSVIYYLGGIVLLVLVHFKGLTIKGATRWLAVGPIRIEPSELIKIVCPLYLAYCLSYFRLPLSLTHFFLCANIVLLPFLLIAKQPDLGTALIVLSIGLIQIFMSGLSYRSIGVLLFSFILSLPLLWNMLHTYQQHRILTLLNPSTDLMGAGYHIMQSKIAIGSGGFWGKGLFASTQVSYHFLPEFHTDFIFALISEETGLVGASMTLILLCTLSVSILLMALTAQSIFEKLMLSAIGFYFFICGCINTAMVCGILPVVGVPLPFLSYGGSNLMVCGVALGLVWNFYRVKYD